MDNEQDQFFRETMLRVQGEDKAWRRVFRSLLISTLRESGRLQQFLRDLYKASHGRLDFDEKALNEWVEAGIDHHLPAPKGVEIDQVCPAGKGFYS